MNRRRTTGFTLTEVMFAVITLGIGLIMVAAVFPVAIQQRKLTSDETIASTIATGGMEYMADLAKIAGRLPANGDVVQPLSAAAWQDVRGNLIMPTDRRFAWVPLYRRAGTALAPAASAQIFLIPVQVRNASTFVAADASNATANLMPRPVTVTIANGASGLPDLITFTGGQQGAVAEGTYVVISADAGSAGWMNGRIYRVGVATTTANQWELTPGFDFNIDSGPDGVASTADDVNGITGAAAYIVGKGFVDPATATYEGPAMDISVYTGYVPAN